MENLPVVTNIRSDPSKPVFKIGPRSYGPYFAPVITNTQFFSIPPVGIIVEKSQDPESVGWTEKKRSGKIHMSNYSIRKTVTEKFAAGIEKVGLFARCDFVRTVGENPDVCYGVVDTKLFTRWKEQGDFHYWSYVKQVPVTLLSDRPDPSSAVSATQTSVIAQMKSGYDVLTELAELKKTRESFVDLSTSARSTFDKFFKNVDPKLMRDFDNKPLTARQLMNSTDKAARKLGSKWMAYRYLIMPILYSYKDIEGLILNSGISYKTFHSTETINVDVPILPIFRSGTNIYERWSGSVTVKSTAKVGYTKESLSSYVSNQLAINPFSTAWELVPFSFVLDWVVNVGDFIAASTSLDFSIDSGFCTSVRTRLKRELVLDDQRKNTETVNLYSGATNICIPVSPRTFSYIDESHTTEPLIREEFDHYERFTFSAGDATLAVHDSVMNWKRAIDSSVLSHTQLKNLLRRFK